MAESLKDIVFKAISVWPPWGWAIFNRGKDVENRSRPFHHRGPLIIHQSASRFDVNGVAAIEEITGMPAPPVRHAYARGALIGYVEMLSCVREHESRWANRGLYHYVMANQVKFRKPIPFKGGQFVFNVTADKIRSDDLVGLLDLYKKYNKEGRVA